MYGFLTRCPVPSGKNSPFSFRRPIVYSRSCSQIKHGRAEFSVSLRNLGTPFLFGEQEFLKFENGIFFRDNTNYISLIEGLKSKAIVSLHPRRFGKSLFLNTLKEYYDVHNKDEKNWKEKFGRFNIFHNPTPNRASFLVLPLNFSRIETSSFQTFNESFNEMNNNDLKAFLKKYKSEVSLPPSEITNNFLYNFDRLVTALKDTGQKVIYGN